MVTGLRLKAGIILAAIAAVLILATPSVASAQSTAGELCAGANLTFETTGNNTSCNRGGSPERRLTDLVRDIVNIFSVIVGIVAVIMIIIGGFKYITSGGDSGSITSAKHTIIYALVGLVIVALAQFIVKFVLSKATEVGGGS
jgi:cytochrome bd-type quinol oxidase subunit 2